MGEWKIVAYSKAYDDPVFEMRIMASDDDANFIHDCVSKSYPDYNILMEMV